MARSKILGMVRLTVLSGLVLTSVLGCSQPLTTREKGTLLGGGLGAGAGALIAGGKGAAIGGALGAVGGGLTGDQLQQQEQTQSEQQQQIEEQQREIERQQHELEHLRSQEER
ncbi:MAG: glycine zipper domain-containing protein [Candidatus Binatia bacterium]